MLSAVNVRRSLSAARYARTDPAAVHPRPDAVPLETPLDT
jgi:hypothetical protein